MGRMLAAACAASLLLASAVAAQEVKGRPEQMKDKSSKSPAGSRKAAEGSTTAAAPEADAADLTVPDKPSEPERPRYSPAGKRNPFRPAGLPTKSRRPPRDNLSPLERYEIGQLKLVGIVWDAEEPKAMVEDSAGLGYIVKVGTAIGTNDGKIKAISKNEVVIKETVIDFYGATKDREIRMKLPAE